MSLQGQNFGAYGLYITQAQFKNTGVYECVAETTLDSTSKAATLTVTGNVKGIHFSFFFAHDIHVNK